MRTASACIAVLALAASPALPAGPTASAMSMSCSSPHVHFAERHDVADARFAIDTENGKVTLLLTERVVAYQLSDRTLHRVSRELQNKEEEQQDNWLASKIVTAVSATVRGLIDHSFECRLRDIRDVSYEDGRLEFIGKNGKPVFDDTDRDMDVASSFSERDARAFVREFRRLKAEGS
jgi:hypothetical protein